MRLTTLPDAHMCLMMPEWDEGRGLISRGERICVKEGGALVRHSKLAQR